jgi:hypothetical protein
MVNKLHQEEQAVIDERYERSIAIQQARSVKAAARRKSLVFRNGDARRIRELHAQIQLLRQVELHQSYELKWAGSSPLNIKALSSNGRQRKMQRRRESVAFRNQEGRKHRELEERIRSKKLSAEINEESELVVISNLTDKIFTERIFLMHHHRLCHQTTAILRIIPDASSSLTSSRLFSVLNIHHHTSAQNYGRLTIRRNLSKTSDLSSFQEGGRAFSRIPDTIFYQAGVSFGRQKSDVSTLFFP